MKDSLYPKRGLAFAGGYWVDLSICHVGGSVSVCVGTLATRRSNGVIYDEGSGPCGIRSTYEGLDTKGLSPAFGGTRRRQSATWLHILELQQRWAPRLA